MQKFTEKKRRGRSDGRTASTRYSSRRVLFNQRRAGLDFSSSLQMKENQSMPYDESEKNRTYDFSHQRLVWYIADTGGGRG